MSQVTFVSQITFVSCGASRESAVSKLAIVTFSNINNGTRLFVFTVMVSIAAAVCREINDT